MLGTISLELESFSLRERGSGRGTEFDRHANDFVRSMHSLQRLHLVLDPHWDEPDDRLLDWSALDVYAHKVKSLKVHCTWNHELFALGLEGSDFRHFCKKASALQQISISGITIQPMPRYSTFGSMPDEPGFLLYFVVRLQSNYANYVH